MATGELPDFTARPATHLQLLEYSHQHEDFFMGFTTALKEERGINTDTVKGYVREILLQLHLAARRRLGLRYQNRRCENLRKDPRPVSAQMAAEMGVAVPKFGPNLGRDLRYERLRPSI